MPLQYLFEWNDRSKVLGEIKSLDLTAEEMNAVAGALDREGLGSEAVPTGRDLAIDSIVKVKAALESSRAAWVETLENRANECQGHTDEDAIVYYAFFVLAALYDAASDASSDAADAEEAMAEAVAWRMGALADHLKEGQAGLESASQKLRDLQAEHRSLIEASRESARASPVHQGALVLPFAVYATAAAVAGFARAPRYLQVAFWLAYVGYSHRSALGGLVSARG